ncbi:MAG: PAS domain S-box protein, partial [Myxococcales bacterium]
MSGREPPQADVDAPQHGARALEAFFALELVGVAQADPVTRRFLRVNQSFCQLTGFGPDELAAMTFHDLTHPDDREADVSGYDALLRGEVRSLVRQKRYVCRSGKVAHVLVTGSVVRDAEGRPRYSVAVVQDLTPQRAVEESLRESEARVRSLLDSTAEGVWGVDLAGRCTFANPACARLLGFDSAEALIGRNMHQLTHHTRADGTPYPERECRVYEAFRTGKGFDVEDELFFRSDGSAFAVQYRSNPILREGRVAGAVVVFRDVSERRRAEAERARTLALLDTIANHAAEALYLMDAEGRTTFMNAAAERMFGWTREEALGKVLHDLVHYKRPDGSPFPISSCPLGDVMRSARAVLEHQDEFVHRDGHFVPVSCSNAPVIDDGRVTGAVLVVHDLTEQRRRTLEERRRAEFEQQLIGIVSHDLRNPLSAMLGSARALLMKSEELDPKVVKSLARIVSSGERATRMVRDLLDFTQARLRGAIPLEISTVDAHAVVAQVVEEVQQTHGHRELRFEASGDGVGAWDPDRLSQIVTNLAVNAVAYSREDTPVTVRTRGLADELVIEVHNHGEPIAAAQRALLFQPFQRGGTKRLAASGSLGLGLFIV